MSLQLTFFAYKYRKTDGPSLKKKMTKACTDMDGSVRFVSCLKKILT